MLHYQHHVMLNHDCLLHKVRTNAPALSCADVLITTVPVNSTGAEESVISVYQQNAPALITSCPPMFKSLANVPRLVKLDAVTPELSVLPVNVPALSSYSYITCSIKVCSIDCSSSL